MVTGKDPKIPGIEENCFGEMTYHMCHRMSKAMHAIRAVQDIATETIKARQEMNSPAEPFFTVPIVLARIRCAYPHFPLSHTGQNPY